MADLLGTMGIKPLAQEDTLNQAREDILNALSKSESNLIAERHNKPFKILAERTSTNVAKTDGYVTAISISGKSGRLRSAAIQYAYKNSSSYGTTMNPPQIAMSISIDGTVVCEGQISGNSNQSKIIKRTVGVAPLNLLSSGCMYGDMADTQSYLTMAQSNVVNELTGFDTSNDGILTIKDGNTGSTAYFVYIDDYVEFHDSVEIKYYVIESGNNSGGTQSEAINAEILYTPDEED